MKTVALTIIAVLAIVTAGCSEGSTYKDANKNCLKAGNKNCELWLQGHDDTSIPTTMSGLSQVRKNRMYPGDTFEIHSPDGTQIIYIKETTQGAVVGVYETEKTK